MKSINPEDFKVVNKIELSKLPTNLDIRASDDKKEDKNTDTGTSVSYMAYTDTTSVNYGDLLTLFQGPNPRKGAIFIATTNDLEYIQDKCPALVRPGRLTPVEITYMNKGEFIDFCNYHFKDEKIDANKIPDDVALQQSRITEMMQQVRKVSWTLEEFIGKALKIDKNNKVRKVVIKVRID
jgi:hypothetical protein